MERARNITHRMLGFAKRMEPTQDNVDLNHVAVQTVKFLENEAMHRNIEIIQDMDKSLPKINSDTARLQQVLLNILENALDAIEKDGRIFLTTSHDQDWIRVSIKDTGPGMDKNTLEKIFDPFFSTKKVGEGTGLGLSISYGIVEKLGGRLTVKSEVGQGSEFIMLLPV